MADNLKNMDVDALLTLRGDVELMLAEKGRDPHSSPHFLKQKNRRRAEFV